MTVRSARLDLTLDGRWLRITLQNDVGESTGIPHLHCPHCCERVSWAFISTTVDMPYPNVLTYMRSTFSPPVPATSHCINGSSLSSMMRSVRLCGSGCALPLTHDVHHG